MTTAVDGNSSQPSQPIDITRSNPHNQIPSPTNDYLQHHAAGYGGSIETASDPIMSPPSNRQSYHMNPHSYEMNESQITSSGRKLKWSKTRCVPRMLNVFVQKREQFLQRDRKLARYQLDAGDGDWFWRLAADTFNDKTLHEIDENLFERDESYPVELRDLDPYYRDGYVVTTTKLKSEFRDLRSIFMKYFSNFQKSGQGDGEAEEDDVEREDEDDSDNVKKKRGVFKSFY